MGWCIRDRVTNTPLVQGYISMQSFSITTFIRMCDSRQKYQVRWWQDRNMRRVWCGGKQEPGAKWGSSSNGLLWPAGERKADRSVYTVSSGTWRVRAACTIIGKNWACACYFDIKQFYACTAHRPQNLSSSCLLILRLLTYNLCLCVLWLLPDLVSITSRSVDSNYQRPLGGPGICQFAVLYACVPRSDCWMNGWMDEARCEQTLTLNHTCSLRKCKRNLLPRVGRFKKKTTQFCHR